MKKYLELDFETERGTLSLDITVTPVDDSFTCHNQAGDLYTHSIHGWELERIDHASLDIKMKCARGRIDISENMVFKLISVEELTQAIDRELS